MISQQKPPPLLVIPSAVTELRKVSVSNYIINSCDEEKKQLTDINAKIVIITNCISQGIFYPELIDKINRYKEEKVRLTMIVNSSSNRYVSKEEIKKLLTNKISSCKNIISLVRTFVVSALVYSHKIITLNLCGYVKTTRGGKLKSKILAGKNS